MDLLKRNIPEATADAFRSRDSLVMFMNDAHNEVNRRLGKREYSLTEHYAVYRPREYASRDTGCVVPLCVAVIAYTAIYLYSAKRRTHVPLYV